MTDDITKPKGKIEIYKIDINNKSYIGITLQGVQKRLFQHIYSANCNSEKYSKKHTKLSYAIRKYGYKDISIEILDVVHEYEKALEREKYFIALFDTTNPEKGYNMLKSGGFKPNTNKEYYKTDAYRKKRSDAVLGIKNGRYSGYSDEEIITEAINFYIKKGNIIQTDWFKYCKELGMPCNYDKKTKFRFDGEGIDGFYKQFLNKCKNMNISINFSDIVSLKCKKIVLSRFRKIYENILGNRLSIEELKYFAYICPKMKKLIERSNN
jgi:group I intron endonuclease